MASSTQEWMDGQYRRDFQKGRCLSTLRNQPDWLVLNDSTAAGSLALGSRELEKVLLESTSDSPLSPLRTSVAIKFITEIDSFPARRRRARF